MCGSRLPDENHSVIAKRAVSMKIHWKNLFSDIHILKEISEV